jgi:hypothetical protein
MAGENCHQGHYRELTAVVLSGAGSGVRHSNDDLCVVTFKADNHARWMMYVESSYILDCKVKVAVYDTRMLTEWVKPVVSAHVFVLRHFFF